jgi:hypothetical protein
MARLPLQALDDIKVYMDRRASATKYKPLRMELAEPARMAPPLVLGARLARKG